MVCTSDGDAAAQSQSSRASSLPRDLHLAEERGMSGDAGGSELAHEEAGACCGEGAAGISLRELACHDSAGTSDGMNGGHKWSVHPVEMQRPRASLREQARSHGICIWPKSGECPEIPVGVSLFTKRPVHAVEREWLESVFFRWRPRASASPGDLPFAKDQTAPVAAWCGES